MHHLVYHYIKHIIHITDKINNYIKNNKSILIRPIHIMNNTLYLIFISIGTHIIEKM